MLSAVVLCADARVPVSVSAEAMVRTLSSLVPAAIEGLVRDVTLATVAGDPQAARVADHAGCGLVEAASPGLVIAGALAATRGDLVFVLRAGRAPEHGFLEELVDLFDGSAHRLPSAVLRAAPASFAARLAPALSPVEGLIGRKSLLPRDASSLEGLRRALSAPVTLRSRLRRVV
jgi:hypothetical protein